MSERNEGLVATVSARALMRLAPSLSDLGERGHQAPAMLLHQAPLVGPLRHHRQRLRGGDVVARPGAGRIGLDGRLGVEDARHLRGVGGLGHAAAHASALGLLLGRGRRRRRRGRVVVPVGQHLDADQQQARCGSGDERHVRHRRCPTARRPGSAPVPPSGPRPCSRAPSGPASVAASPRIRARRSRVVRGTRPRWPRGRRWR